MKITHTGLNGGRGVDILDLLGYRGIMFLLNSNRSSTNVFYKHSLFYSDFICDVTMNNPNSTFILRLKVSKKTESILSVRCSLRLSLFYDTTTETFDFPSVQFILPV